MPGRIRSYSATPALTLRPGDWSDATFLKDKGAVDDETSPTTADITEFCAHVDNDYISVMMAWDHTGFTGGNASTPSTRLDVDADGLFDYNILTTLGGTPASLQGYSTIRTSGRAKKFEDNSSDPVWAAI